MPDDLTVSFCKAAKYPLWAPLNSICFHISTSCSLSLLDGAASAGGEGGEGEGRKGGKGLPPGYWENVSRLCKAPGSVRASQASPFKKAQGGRKERKLTYLKWSAEE